ncbi:hypothetical protein DNTS_004202, partial [Danionella cerebrum]
MSPDCFRALRTATRQNNWTKKNMDKAEKRTEMFQTEENLTDGEVQTEELCCESIPCSGPDCFRALRTATRQNNWMIKNTLKRPTTTKQNVSSREKPILNTTNPLLIKHKIQATTQEMTRYCRGLYLRNITGRITARWIDDKVTSIYLVGVTFEDGPGGVVPEAGLAWDLGGLQELPLGAERIQALMLGDPGLCPLSEAAGGKGASGESSGGGRGVPGWEPGAAATSTSANNCPGRQGSGRAQSVRVGRRIWTMSIPDSSTSDSATKSTTLSSLRRRKGDFRPFHTLLNKPRPLLRLKGEYLVIQKVIVQWHLSSGLQGTRITRGPSYGGLVEQWGPDSLMLVVCVECSDYNEFNEDSPMNNAVTNNTEEDLDPLLRDGISDTHPLQLEPQTDDSLPGNDQSPAANSVSAAKAQKQTAANLTPRGNCLTLNDHDHIRQFLQEFTFRGLLPHIEKNIRQFNDQ